MTNCDLQNIGNEFSRKPIALAVQQNSDLKDKLSSTILKLLNQRKLENLKEKWWNRNNDKKECQDTKKQSDGISINNIGLGGEALAPILIIICSRWSVYCHFHWRDSGLCHAIGRVLVLQRQGNQSDHSVGAEKSNRKAILLQKPTANHAKQWREFPPSQPRIDFTTTTE